MQMIKMKMINPNLPIRNVSYVFAFLVCNCIKENTKIFKKERMNLHDTKAKRNI